MYRLLAHQRTIYQNHQPATAPDPRCRLGSLSQHFGEDSLLQALAAEVDSAVAPNLRRRYAAVATTVRTEDYAESLLGDQPPDMLPACPTALVVALPDEFAPSLLELVGQTPCPDAMGDFIGGHALPYLAWTCRLADDSKVNLTVPMALLATDVYPMGRRRLQPIWVPVLMVAGDTVAVGGFNVDAAWLVRCQYTRHFLRVNREPDQIHLPAHARQQVERFGLAPWRFGRYRDPATGRQDLMATDWGDVPPSWA